MDTLNTFEWNTAYKVSARTRVLREHKDRFKSYVSMIYFNNLQNASWAIAEAFPYNDGTPFIVNVEAETSGEEIDLTNATAQYFEDGAIKVLVLSGYSIEEGVSIEEDSDFVRLQIYDSDYSLYCSIVNLENVSIVLEHSKLRKIDFFSENIPVDLYKSEEYLLTHAEDSSWNLVYMNGANENDPIDCYLIPNESGINYLSSTSNTLTYSNFADGEYYVFAPWKIDGSREWIMLTDENSNVYAVDLASGVYTIFEVKRSGTTLQIRKIKAKRSTGLLGEDRIMLTDAGITATGSWKTITSLSFGLPAIHYRRYASNPYPSFISVINPSDSFTSTGTTETLDSIREIDRAEPKLIKIINIPYYPTSYEWDSLTEKITPLDDIWAVSSNKLKLNDLDSKFASTIITSIENPLNIFDMGAFIPSDSANRDDEYESKLFHSDYYLPKFVYDSFGFNFQLEKMNEEYSVSQYFSFEFIMTTTINSKFMFRFPDYNLKLSQEDYDNILTIARNNELPIYNSAYITYLRTAYRYDLKALDISRTGAMSSYFTDLAERFNNVAGSAVGIAYAKKPSQERSGSFGLLSTITTYPNAVIQMATGLLGKQNSIDAKLAQLKNQAVSVSGSDDIDLLEAYSSNRAKLVIYKVHDRVKQLLADLFYYYGYRTEEIKIPTTNTRIWFNFIQCELELTGVDYNITEILKNDIISRFSVGATFLHYHNSAWDFEQVKENWESFLFPNT